MQKELKEYPIPQPLHKRFILALLGGLIIIGVFVCLGVLLNSGALFGLASLGCFPLIYFMCMVFGSKYESELRNRANRIRRYLRNYDHQLDDQVGLSWNVSNLGSYVRVNMFEPRTSKPLNQILDKDDRKPHSRPKPEIYDPWKS
jgi:hypothetical protein